MKGRIYLKNTPHEFVKENNVSLADGSDNYKCLVCGIRGNRPAFQEYVNIGRGKKEIFYKCNKPNDEKKITIRIKLTRDIPVNSDRLIKNSEWEVVVGPKGTERMDGVWVVDDNDVVRVLPGEYEEI